MDKLVHAIHVVFRKKPQVKHGYLVTAVEIDALETTDNCPPEERV
jgi:hypothetical protein